MAHLYPSLHEKFRMEGLCPICLIEMAHTPRFSCANSHVICHRCRPYYYSCPQCLQPLSEIPPDSPMAPFEPPPPTHFMPHPPHLTCPYPPTAPDIQEFHRHEQQHYNWQPPSPPREDQELVECPYAHLGCTAKFVPQLRNLHVSRCQYKHHSAEAPEQCEQPQDSERIPCRYQSVGCNVRAPHWRLRSHEELCIYKDRTGASDPQLEELGEHLEGSCRLGGEPDRLVDCRFRSRGCKVRMPYWRKQSHEAKCNHNRGEDECAEPPRMTQCWEPPMPQRMLDPEEQSECRWAEYGCRVRPKCGRKEQHEEKCNYRMEECAYKHRGCGHLFQPSRRYAHESSCGYAS